jgi:hypothetical protein
MGLHRSHFCQSLNDLRGGGKFYAVHPKRVDTVSIRKGRQYGRTGKTVCLVLNAQTKFGLHDKTIKPPGYMDVRVPSARGGNSAQVESLARRSAKGNRSSVGRTGKECGERSARLRLHKNRGGSEFRRTLALCPPVDYQGAPGHQPRQDVMQPDLTPPPQNSELVSRPTLLVQHSTTNTQV